MPLLHEWDEFYWESDEYAARPIRDNLIDVARMLHALSEAKFIGESYRRRLAVHEKTVLAARACIPDARGDDA